jgi:hypothetical protein
MYSIPQNLTNFTAIMSYVNTVTGGSAITLLLVLAPVIIISLISLPFGLGMAFMLGSFVGAVLSIFFSSAGLVSNSVVFIFALLSGISVFANVIIKKKGGN